MNTTPFTKLFISIPALVAGCALAPASDKVALEVPAEWRGAPRTHGEAQPKDLSAWWKGFKDPVLDDLISKALLANHDLKIATARVREAKAMVIVVESRLYPSLDITASGGREKRIDRVIPRPTNTGIELTTPTGDAGSIGLTAAWEIDVFGGNGLNAEAAAAQARGAEDGHGAAQVGLLAQVATNYLELRGAQTQTAILKENIKVQRQRLRLLEAFSRAGLANELDIARQQTLLRTTEGTLPVLTNATATLTHRLSVLLGEPPADLGPKLARGAPLPRALPNIPGLLPADLLGQRPDLRGAQAEVTAAAASLGSARADLFPKLMLSASGGFGALAVGGFPGLAEGVYALGAGLTAPIFNAGRIRANIEAADARLSQVAANYEKTFLLALEEVENAFVAHTTARERKIELSEAAHAAARAERLAHEFYKRGVTDFLSVLDAQRAKLAAEDEQAKAETMVTVSMVSLYRAFGGGWDAPANPREQVRYSSRISSTAPATAVEDGLT